MKKVKALTFDEFNGVSGDGIGIPYQGGAVLMNYEFLFDCVSVKSATPMIAVELVGTSKTDLANPNKDIMIGVGGYVTSGSGRSRPSPLYFKDDKFYSAAIDDLGMEYVGRQSVGVVKRKFVCLYEVDISNPDDFESMMDKSPEAIEQRRGILNKLRLLLGVTQGQTVPDPCLWRMSAARAGRQP